VRQLYRVLQLQGYIGCLTAVADFLSYVRKSRGLPAFVSTDLLAPGLAFPYARLCPKTAAWLVSADPETLTDHERALATALPTLHQDIQLAAQAAQRFAHLARTRTADQFDVWLSDMCHASLSQLRSFARSLYKDYPAVRAALTLPYSNGPVEGHVNRLKFVKRQMFGRAKFDLLRIRVLAASP
jgi:transposase